MFLVAGRPDFGARAAAGAGLLGVAFLASALPAFACPTGPDLGGVLEGDLGPAPEGAYEEVACLEVRNDLDFERREVAWSGVPVPRELDLVTAADLDELVVVGPGERHLAAQLEVLGRWGAPPDGLSGEPLPPVRWLQVAVPARVPAASGSGDGVAAYALRRSADPPASADPFAATVTAAGSRWEVDTGLATFTLDPASPALFHEIAVDPDDDGTGRTTVYQHAAGAGPRLVLPDGGGELVLDTTGAGEVVVDPGGFELVETGPVKVVALLRGHFSDPGGSTLCTRDGLSYERFGFTAVATFFRGSRHVRLGFVLRNECSDAWSGPWTDDAVTVRRASWELPFDLGGTATLYAGGSGALAAAPGGTSTVRVEQRKGAGSPWTRRARVRHDGTAVESAEAFDRPLAAAAGSTLAAAGQLAWMRHREPQAVAAATDGTLSLEIVGEDLVVGEGKGLWNAARVSLVPVTGTLPADIETARGEGAAELERGLLVRLPLDDLNASGALPSLGTEDASTVKTAYVTLMDELHGQTVGPGGQWDRAKTFGSQLWPDVQSDLWQVDNDSPDENSGAMNYWDPAGAELLEMLRSGEPRWAWDFALAQARLQMHAAYLNVGAQTHGNRAGFAVTSGGTGEGHWHRSAFGSDDYTYAMGMRLAYLLRPDPALRDRFARAGSTAVGRYSIPEEDEALREQFVDQVDLTRQVVQHFGLLADCAALVPGAQGEACHDRLLEVVGELARDNLRAGVLCQGDDPPTTSCSTPQQFMQNALMVPFLDRMLRSYGDVEGLLRRGVADSARVLYDWGLPKLGDGVSLDVGGSWAAGLDCTLDATGTEVSSCSAAPDSDGNLGMYQPTKPHTVAILLLGHDADPSIDLCQVARDAYDDPALTDGWQDFLGNDAGWTKGSSQMMQAMAYGVGLYDTCGVCTLGETLDLSAQTVTTIETFEACRTVTAGAGFAVQDPGEVTFRAGERIVLSDGFSVGTAASFTAEVDPALRSQ